MRRSLHLYCKEVVKAKRRKHRQTMRFGQLIEYNMRDIFLQKSYTKCAREASLRPFYKKLQFSISLDHQSEML